MRPLTAAEMDELRHGDAGPMRITDAATGLEYVVVRADIFEQLQSAVAAATRRAGWDDPALDAYESYRKPA